MAGKGIVDPNQTIDALIAEKQDLYAEWKELQRANSERNWDAEKGERFDFINSEFDRIDAAVEAEEIVVKRNAAFEKQESLMDRARSVARSMAGVEGEGVADRLVSSGAVYEDAATDGEKTIDIKRAELKRAVYGFLRGKHANAIERQSMSGHGWAHTDRIELELPRIYPGANEIVRQMPVGRYTDEQRKDFFLRNIKRDLGTGTDPAGGFIVPPAAMQAIDIALQFYNTARQYADVIRMPHGREMPWPTISDVTEIGEIIDENAPANEATMTFGQVTTKPFLFSSRYVPVSIQLLMDSNENMDALIGRLVTERIARKQSVDFAVGSGVAEPEGLATASAASGVTLAAANAPTTDELIAIKYSVDRAYRQVGHGWVIADSVLGNIRSIGSAEADGRILFQPSLAFGEPSTIDGDPYYVNNDLDTALSGRPILYGMLSKFKIHDGSTLVIRRLDELRALQHQVVYLGFLRSDCKLIDAGTEPVKHGLNPAA